MQLDRRHVAVQPPRRAPEASRGETTCVSDPSGDDPGALAASLVGEQFGARHPGHGDLQVDTIQQRTGQPPQVATTAVGRADAGGLSGAGAGVRSKDQREPGRIGGDAAGAGDSDASLLQRLPQPVEDTGRELRGLVKEEHSTVGQAGRTWPRHPRAPSDDRGHAGRVVRVLEGCTGDQRLFAQPAGDRVDRRDLERFVQRQRRQDARQSLRQHRLPGARRPEQEQMVTAGGGHLDSRPPDRLTADVHEVEQADRRGCRLQFCRLVSASLPSQ